MTKAVKLFEGTKGHLSTEEHAQREDAKEELFNHEELNTQPPIGCHSLPLVNGIG